jgi:hypothetical protein
MRRLKNYYATWAGAAAAALLAVSLPHHAAANTAFADATTTDPSNPTPCSACHYRGRESEGRQGLNQVGQQFFFNCRINAAHDCHTLPQLANLPVTPTPGPAPAPQSGFQTARFKDVCQSGDSYYAVQPGDGGHKILFELKKFHRVHLLLPEGSTYALSCGTWPAAADAMRPVEFE